MSLHFTPLTIKSITPETADAYTITFAMPVDAEQFRYLAGQYLTLKVEVGGEQLRRAFSLSSAPGVDADLAVTIKAIENGRVSNHLKNTAKVGDSIEVFPPLGNFVVETHPTHRRHYVLLGAGSGITPLFSILKSVLAHEPASTVTLIYGNRDESSIIFQQQLEALSAQYKDRLRVVHILSRPSAQWQGLAGRLEGDFVRSVIENALAGNDRHALYYMCGPQAMMDGLNEVLAAMHVPPIDIHREYYSAPPIPDDQEEDYAYEIIDTHVKLRLDFGAHNVHVPVGVNILQAALDAGIEPPYACQEGVCSTCRARLHSGLVQMDIREGLSDEEIQAGYVLTCQCYPLTDDVELEFC